MLMYTDGFEDMKLCPLDHMVKDASYHGTWHVHNLPVNH